MFGLCELFFSVVRGDVFLVSFLCVCPPGTGESLSRAKGVGGICDILEIGFVLLSTGGENVQFCPLGIWGSNREQKNIIVEVSA